MTDGTDPVCPDCDGHTPPDIYAETGLCEACGLAEEMWADLGFPDTPASDLDAALEIDQAERVEREAFHYDDLHND